MFGPCLTLDVYNCLSLLRLGFYNKSPLSRLYGHSPLAK